MKKLKLIGKDLKELETFCIKNNFPKFRGMQLYKWLYQKSINNLEDMSNLPKKLKDLIIKKCIIDDLKINKKQFSSDDNTTKFLLKTSDDKFIECVSMINESRHTICISSQIGCSVDCDFCATGKMGIIRNLDTGEILNQISIIKNNISNKITNVVFMGMGEPFLNYKNVLNACSILADENAYNLSSKRITISTSGILPKIKKFIADNEKYKLAISLNASNNKVRDILIPINKKWPIEELISELKNYKYHKRRTIMFEYIMLKNINDKPEHAYELINLLKIFYCKINIIPYNPIDSHYKRSDKDNIINFYNIINNSKYDHKAFIRWSKGQDIDAWCGQLATKNDA